MAVECVSVATCFEDLQKKIIQLFLVDIDKRVISGIQMDHVHSYSNIFSIDDKFKHPLLMLNR